MLRTGGRARRPAGPPAARSQARLVAGLVVSAARWRRSSSVAVLLAATTAVAAAVLGPLWATAAEDALALDQVRRAELVQRQLVTEVQANVPSGGVVTVPVVGLQRAEEAGQVTGPAGDALTPTRLLLTTSGRLRVVALTPEGEAGAVGSARLAWTDGDCTRFPLLAGRCGGTGSVMVSDRTARALGLSVGSVLDVPDFAGEPVRPGSGEPFVRQLRVTGVYGTGSPEDAHWAGTDLLGLGPARRVDGQLLPPRVDAVLVDRVLVEALSQTAVTASARRSLLSDRRTAPELAVVREGLQRHVGALRSDAGGTRVQAPVLRLVEDIAAQGRDARRLALVLGAQLLLLACAVLGLVVASSADARAPEVALGRLRGLRWPALAAFCAAEPLLLVVLAVPLGVLAGGLGAAALAAAALPVPVALRPDPVLGLSLAAALVAAVAAVVVGVRLVLARGVLVRGGGPAGAGRVVLDAVLVSLAAAALWQVVSERSASGSGLLAPVLAALAGGVLLARAGGLLARALVRRGAGGSGVAGWLALRRTARVPGGVRTVVLVAAAVSCTTYAAALLAVTDDQRAAQAAVQVGAEAVYRVEPVDVQDLLGAVSRVDPSGRQLMATMTGTRANRPDDARLLAVDSPRLAAVAAWREEWADAPIDRLAQELRPQTAPVVLLTGSRLTVDVRARLIGAARGDVIAAARVVTSSGGRVLVPLGVLLPGDQRLGGELEECSGGCRLEALVLRRVKGRGGLIGTVRLRAVAVDGVESAVTAADGWRPALVDPQDPLSLPSMRLEERGSELALVFAQPRFDELAVLRADVPEAFPLVLPAVVEPRLVGRDGLVEVRVPGPRRDALLGRVVERAVVLPRVLDRGPLVDLELLQRASPADVRTSTQEVWSSTPPDDAVRASLEQEGLEVLEVTSRAEVEQALRSRGSAEVLALLPVVAVLSLGLAVLGLVAHALASARPRAVEAAALQAVGVPRSALRRAARQEVGALLLLGLLAGAVGGGVTAVLTAAQVGGLGLQGVRAPFPDDPPWVPLLVTLVVAAAVLALVVAACAATGLRRGDTRLLRQDAL